MLRDAWELAIKTLSLVELQKVSERLALAKTTRKLGIDNAGTIRYAYGLVVETVRRRNMIAEFVSSVTAPKKLGDFRLYISAFLQLYVYHTRFAGDLATVNLREAEHVCSLARAIIGWQTFRPVERYMGFLLTRQIKHSQEKSSDDEKIALETFHPVWFVKYCFKLFNRHEAIAFLKGSIYPPSICIRLNTLQSSQKDILEELIAQGMQLEKIEPLRHAFKLCQTNLPLRELASFKKGLLFVQDKASCYAVEAANPAPGQTVLDVCAAPGSKTTYIGQLMQNKGKIYALDYSKRRLETWKQEVHRTGVNISELVVGDARGPCPINIEAEVVMLDPPCTSTGVFGRQPSAKWRLAPKSIEIMSGLQWQMINSVAENVKKGGILVYSTCSVTLEENEMLIERFLKWHPEFQLADITPKLGLPGLRGLEKCRRLYPHLHDSNGFFVAKMVKP